MAQGRWETARMVEVYRREEAAGRAAKWLASERRCVHGLSASDAERSRRAATGCKVLCGA